MASSVHRSASVRGFLPAFVGAFLVAGLACADINTDPQFAASIAMDTVPSPSIVAKDSLRDSLGVARPLHASVFNIQGLRIESAPIIFRTADRGVSIDSVTGFVVADTARPTGIRIFAVSGALQSAPDTLFIVPAPDTVVAINPTDSLLYSLTDTSAILSNPLQLQLLHVAAGQSLPVRSYLVSYQITHPVDTVLARLMTRDGVRQSLVDTTAADGTSARRIRLRPLSLTSVEDSVVVLATVRFHGALVAGTPVRFVVQVKPHP
jgi:hypothetical protein